MPEWIFFIHIGYGEPGIYCINGQGDDHREIGIYFLWASTLPCGMLYFSDSLYSVWIKKRKKKEEKH